MRSLKTIMYVLGGLFAAAYILNPGAGVFELIPDNLPFVGNLDEAAAMTLLIACVRALRALHRPTPTLPDRAPHSEAA